MVNFQKFGIRSSLGTTKWKTLMQNTNTKVRMIKCRFDLVSLSQYWGIDWLIVGHRFLTSWYLTFDLHVITMPNIFLSSCAIFFKVIISMSISKSAFCVGWFPMIIFQAFLFLVRSLLTFLSYRPLWLPLFVFPALSSEQRTTRLTVSKFTKSSTLFHSFTFYI